MAVTLPSIILPAYPASLKATIGHDVVFCLRERRAGTAIRSAANLRACGQVTRLTQGAAGFVVTI